MNINDLWKALDLLKKYIHDDELFASCWGYVVPLDDAQRLFSVFLKEQAETVDLKVLSQKAKTREEIRVETRELKRTYDTDGTYNPFNIVNPEVQRRLNGKWVSLEDVTALLTPILKELDEANLLCELQASRISGLETFKKQYNGIVLVDRKEASDRINKVLSLSINRKQLEIKKDKLQKRLDELASQGHWTSESVSLSSAISVLKELLAGLPLCEKCKIPMKVLSKSDENGE